MRSFAVSIESELLQLSFEVLVFSLEFFPVISHLALHFGVDSVNCLLVFLRRNT